LHSYTHTAASAASTPAQDCENVPKDPVDNTTVT